jgi:uncharacterized protein YbjT (DUF2867 family)
MKLLVTGATGVLGREVLLAARSSGIVVRALSRRPAAAVGEGEEWVQADLVSDEGLENAVAGIDAIVHAASDPRRAGTVDVIGTRRLVDAAEAAKVRHLIFVSIVGVDAVPVAFYKRKLAAEQIVGAGRVPFSILRATQFHSFLDQMIAGTARVPFVLPIPSGILVQPVEASEVAERLMRCVAEGPRGRVTDFGGPEVLSWREAAAQWQAARHTTKKAIPVPLPGAAAKALRAGLGTVPNGDRGVITWREWLMHTSDR